MCDNIFENWQNSRFFETSCQNITFYHCCYFFNFFLRNYAIILPKIGKIPDFLRVILEIKLFWWLIVFKCAIFVCMYAIISKNIGPNTQFLLIITEFWNFFAADGISEFWAQILPSCSEI